MKKIRLAIVTAFGLEAIVKKELMDMGYDNLKVENGWIFLDADLIDIPKTNIFLRSAERVLLVMGEFEARTFTELFDKTKELHWEKWITKNGKFTVNGKSLKSDLFSVPDCQSIVKKAIVEKLKDEYSVEWFKEEGEEFTVQISLYDNNAVLTIDTTGNREGLFKRGYRSKSVNAPLKETIAAALIQLSFWKADRILLDPMCGSGTILIEAALIGTNTAPGLYRKFAAEDWPAINDDLWSEVRIYAESLIKRDVNLRIYGYDKDEKAIRIAKENAILAGVQNQIEFQVRELNDLELTDDYGILITNPPYGERMGEEDEVIEVIEKLGEISASNLTWSNYIISPFNSFEKHYGRSSSKRRKLFNGNLKVQYYQYFGEKPAKNNQ